MNGKEAMENLKRNLLCDGGAGGVGGWRRRCEGGEPIWKSGASEV